MSPEPLPVLARMMQHISARGPVSIATFMAEANGHYYATRDPLGRAGDFITAPEISQMFGEMIGIWIADLWMRAGHPPFHYAELGPGRGTLARDALRTMAGFGCNPLAVHLVETSPVLRAKQTAILPHAIHHDSIDSLPGDAALIIIANEFFDALPIRQFVATHSGWRERVLGRDRGKLVPLPGSIGVDADVPPVLRRQQPGAIFETCPAAEAIMADLAARIGGQGGAMLTIDYGYDGPAIGDTLQAVSDHRMADPFESPGEVDLTAHVDFTALGEAARGGGMLVAGPVGQGDWLRRIGIDMRLAALIVNAPDRADELTGQRDRLIGAEAMGDLFRVMAAHAPSWPVPEGFSVGCTA